MSKTSMLTDHLLGQVTESDIPEALRQRLEDEKWVCCSCVWFAIRLFQQ